MAETPDDPRWPPGGNVSFDTVFNRLLELKRHHFPQHTARDLADPFIQLLSLTAALGQHALGRVNNSLLQLSPKTATSRRALIALVGELMNRPLRPRVPSRGPAYARLKAAPTVDTELVAVDTRVGQPSITDPVYSVDVARSTGSSVLFAGWREDASASTVTALTFPASFSLDDGDALIIGFDEVFFNSVLLDLTAALPVGPTYAIEYSNEEYGATDAVSVQPSTLIHTISTYMHASEQTPRPGATVRVRHKPTAIEEEVVTTVSGPDILATTSYLGQGAPSASPDDYEVVADWRPIPNVTDETTGLTVDGEISFDVSGLRSDTDEWIQHDTYGFAIRIRNATDPTSLLPATLAFTQPTNPEGSFYVDFAISQGIRQTTVLGNANGSAFQRLTAPSEPLEEPVADPQLTLQVGAELDWVVVADFSDSGSTSKHAIFLEDVDDGWSVVFGDGVVGILPDSGDTVRLKFRTGSVQPGDLDPNTRIRILGSAPLVTDPVLYRGTSGYAEPEASTPDDVRRFRFSILPQLSLRAESAITADEIVTALSGGAPNRATFETSDGRRPFSRALFSLEGAGVRQYRVIVVGPESDPEGDSTSSDMIEAESYLNGDEVGVEIVGGHGPNNTEAIVGSFERRPFLPTVTITIADQRGVRELADQTIRGFFRPHSRDEDDRFRWDFGGRVPMPILFGLLWDAVQGRVFIDISILDGVTTLQDGDSAQLGTFELPTLHASYDPLVNIILVAP